MSRIVVSISNLEEEEEDNYIVEWHNQFPSNGKIKRHQKTCDVVKINDVKIETKGTRIYRYKELISIDVVGDTINIDLHPD